MKEWIAFLLPPAVALVGMRLARLLLGQTLEEKFGLGLRFALGLAVGMLAFSQAVLLFALIGFNGAGLLAWTALIWGIVEVVLMSPKLAASLKQIKFQPAQLWLLLLLPLLYAGWVFGRLSTLEGTLEFDANAFWVFKSKILYLAQGKELMTWFHTPNLSYMHSDYPMLVTCLYTLDYGAVGAVNEFVNKVWPFWMMVALCLGVLSFAQIWKRPHPLPLLTVTLISFLPITLQFIRQEGGTIPMAFYVGITAMLLVTALAYADETALGAGILTLAGCAATKFEGIIYAAIWGCLILVFCWRRGWLKQRVLWKAAIVAALCLVPYFCFRLTKPIPHPESGWMKAGLASPGAALHRFPQTLMLNIGCRFFSADFFHWEPAENNGIKWIGKWTGLSDLANKDISVLPWLLLFLLGYSLWRLKQHRLAIAALVGVTLAQFTILSLALACLPRMQTDTVEMINFCGGNVGRYFYPFITACFLGTILFWFADRNASSPSTGVAETPAPVSASLSPRAKKRR